ncbi:MAG: hypothetical protein ACOC8L_05545 [Spirochaetota bacterium]
MAIYSHRKSVCALMLALVGLTLSGQSAAFVESYADSEAVAGDQTIFLLGIAVGRLEPDARFDESTVQRAAVRSTLAYAVPAPLTLAEFAFLLSEYFEIRPSMMGRLFPGPRYALRDLRTERVIFYEADATAPVPGDVALRTIRRAMTWEAAE